MADRCAVGATIRSYGGRPTLSIGISSGVGFDYEASSHGAECPFDSLYVRAVLSVEELADCGLSDAEALSESNFGDPLAAHGCIEL